MVIHLHLILQRKIVNKVFRSALTGAASFALVLGVFSAPANAITERQNPATPISLSAVGTPTVGSVLTVTKQTYTTFTETRFGVSWFRCNSATTIKNKLSEVDAALAAASCTRLLDADGVPSNKLTTYTVTAKDVGKHMTVVVSANDGVEGVNAGQPNNEGYSLANSLLIAEPAPAPAPSQTTAATPTLTAQTAPATVPATIKPKKKVKIGAKTSAGLPVTVTVAGGCKVKPVVKTTKTKVGKKTVKTKTTTAYTVTMGKKKGATCTITQANAGDATYAPLNSVSTVTLK